MQQVKTNDRALSSTVLDIKRVFQEEGLKLDFERELDFSKEELDGAYPFTEPVRVVGYVENQDSIVKLRCRTEFRYTKECDRCLDVAVCDYEFEFEHIITAKDEETPGMEELVFAPDFRLELFELLREDIILEIPSKHLCKQECNGLCPKCGCNLNHGECDCDLSEADPRLAALGDLLKQMEE